MKVTLYISSSEKNRLDKTSYLDAIGTLSGVLKDASSVVNPIITFEIRELMTLKVMSDDEDLVQDDLSRNVVFDTVWKNFVAKTNYAYIDAFGRYYFITDIIALTNELFEIHFASDVLMSFKDQIRPLQGFVTRSDSHGDITVEDKNRVFKFAKEITIVDYASGVFEANVLDQNSKNWVVTTIVNADSLVWTKPQWSTSQAPSQGLPNVNPERFATKHDCSYVLDSSDFDSLYSQIMTTDSAKAEFLKSIIAFPFIPARENLLVPILFKNQTLTSQLQAYYTTGPWTGYLEEALVVPDPGDSWFYNLSPYNRCEMYLPFYGWIELNIAEVRSHILRVYYNISYEDGTAMIYVYDSNTESVIFSAPCQVGLKVAFSTTNQQELTAQKNANTLNMGIGLVSSAITAGFGVASGSPVAVTNGVMGGVRTVTGLINSNMTMFEKASSTFSSGEHALFAVRHVQLRYTRMVPLESDVTEYRKQFGLPCNKVLTLSSLSGFARVGQIHLDGISGAFSGEMDDIETLLANGVYF